LPISMRLRIEGKEFTIFVVGLRLRRLSSEVTRTILEKLSRIRIPIILLDARSIWSLRHILIATHMALRSWIRRENVAKKLPLEIMLYASATREIDKAIKLLGLKPGLTEIVVCEVVEGLKRDDEIIKEILELLGKETVIEIDDNLLKPGESKRKLISWFNITEEELKATYAKDLDEAVEKCIIARMAYLNISKL